MVNSYDIETFIHNNKAIPYCVCLYFKNNFKNFYYKNNIILESIEFMFKNTKKQENNVIYVHNLNFDGFLIIESISTLEEYEIKSIIRDINIYSIKIIKNEKILEFKCSYKILPISLKKIAEDFKLLKKMIFPYKFSIIDNLNYIGEIPDKSFFNDDISYKEFSKIKKFNFKKYSISYCKRDAHITKKFIEIVINMVKCFNIDFSKINSSPSLSLKIYDKNFNKSKISLNISNILDNTIRKSYFGGRCEVFGNSYEGENIYHYDFSGMYAQCMKEKYPYGNYNIINTKTINGPGFYAIKAFSNLNIPILPHKNVFNNKLMFSNGYIEGIFWYEEIDIFIINGGKILEIMYKIEFDKYDYIFKDFVEYFEKMRMMGGSYKTLSKLIVNSLYGRFGMSDEIDCSFFISKKIYEIINQKIEIKSLKNINDLYLITCEINKKNKRILKEFDLSVYDDKTKSNVVLASCITSKARIKLYKSFLEVIKSEGRILYCDTDSIFAAYYKNMDNKKIGEIYWDISKQDTKIKKAVFSSPKSYACIYSDNKEVIKIKGINKKSLRYDEFSNCFYKNIDICIEDNLEIQRKNLEIKIFSLDKKINLNKYDKRFFIENNKKTLPFFYDGKEYIVHPI